MSSGFSPVPMTLIVALVGATAAQFLGVPAGPLVGATVTVTGLAASGLRPAVPARLRDLGFTTIGVTLGASVTPHFLSDLARYPASLLALTATMLAVMLVSSAAACRWFGATRATALLATAPGAMSYSLSLASERPRPDVDASFIMVLQSLRLLLITLLLPPLVTIVGPGTGAEVVIGGQHSLFLATSLALIAVASLAGTLLDKARMPAAFLLAGVLVSGLGHGLGWLEGRPSPILAFCGFALAGAVVGARFSSVNRMQFRGLLAAGLVSGVISTVLSGLISLAVCRWLSLPFGQVWVAFAPGGVEGMSAMALSLGYDPGYVATHHIYRLLLLLAILPFLVRRKPRNRAGEEP